MMTHEDRAIDALIVLAFLEAVARQPPKLSGPDPELDPEDARALADLGAELGCRILEEEEGFQDPSPPFHPPC